MSTLVEMRFDSALRHALGPDVARFLDEDGITNLMLNTDGRLWLDRAGHGREDTGRVLAADAEAALRLIAHDCGMPLTRTVPVLSATLPRSGERMAATIPPVTAKPTFAIRKPPAVTFELAAFEPKGGEMPATEEEGRNDPSPGDGGPALTALRRAVAERRNILIAGSTGSGKTSCLSALLQIPSVQRDRCLVLEDTREIAVPAAEPEVPMRALVQLSLRYRPDRIILGDVAPAMRPSSSSAP